MTADSIAHNPTPEDSPPIPVSQKGKGANPPQQNTPKLIRQKIVDSKALRSKSGIPSAGNPRRTKTGEHQTVEDKVTRRKIVERKTTESKIPESQTSSVLSTKDNLSGPPASKAISTPKSVSSLRKSILNRRRTERTGTISKIYYKLAQKRRLKKNLIRGMILLIPLFFLALSTVWLWGNQTQTSEIIRSVQAGLFALENNHLQEATINLQYALDGYRTYHVDYPEMWWQRDTLLFTAMLRATQGWRSLGDFQKCLETFAAIAFHNTAGMNSWVGRQMEADVNDFLDRSHWMEDQYVDIYSAIQKVSPASWGTCDLLLIQTTEKISLQLFPMETRLKESDFVIYGTIRPMMTSQEDELLVEGIRYYYIDRLPGSILMKLSSTLPAHVRERVFWYSQSGLKCLFFLKNPEEPVLTKLENILLSESYSTEPFNRLYRE